MATVEINFQVRIITNVLDLLRPVRSAIALVDGPRRLLGGLGWDLDAIPGFPFGQLDTQLAAFGTAYDQLQAKLEPPPSTLEDWAAVVEATAQAIDAVIAIGDILGGLAIPDLASVGAELVNLLTAQFLASLHPTLYQLLVLLTIVQPKAIAPVIDEARGEYLRFPVTIPEVKLGHLADLIRDPVGTLKAEYGLSGGLTNPNATADKLFPRVAAVLMSLDVNAVFGVPASIGARFGTLGHEIASHMLTIFERVAAAPDLDLGFGATFSLSSDIGLVVRPFGTLDFRTTLGSWAIAVDADVGVEGFAVSSNDVVFPSGSPIDAVDLQIAAAKLPAPDQVSDDGTGPAFLIGSATSTRLELGEFQVIADAGLRSGAVDYGASVEIRRGALVVSSGDGDGFLAKVLPSNTRIDFDFGIAYSKLGGLRLRGSAGLELNLPVHVSIAGVVDIDAVQLGIKTAGQDLAILTSANVRAQLGPVAATAEKIGLAATLQFPDGGGNLGPVDVSLGFKLPDGIGISVNAGPVTGGGFLFIDRDAGRYSGAVELTVFGVSVKAFGVVDTKFPDGREGFSFVIIIVAEFTPIQLGFGFTLLGIGGLVGINRGVDEQGLAAAVRTGSLAHVLFPHDPVRDAPAIIHDLTTIFPATEGHFIVGPMAKLGWGTPTLITADLGIVIELPGPRIVVLGVLRMQLPDPKLPILRLQMAVAGVIDFPAQTFSLDASLFDSTVAGYVVTADMAYRLGFGNNAKFLLSVGGFNPGFEAPPAFPDLRRATVDLGVSGNPSLTASGYFALTSNTAQIGASIELRASGAGIRLHGWMGFDVMFVFSPFSFEASISAGVRVSFHGVGFGITLRGSLKGPTPWHLRGRVCVSVLWWDACLPIDVKFGSREPAALPEIDPWEGNPAVPIIGLRAAIEDVRNWEGSAPPAEFAVVSLAEAAAAVRTPIDPLGTATLRQKVAPFNLKLEKFGEYAPINNDTFSLGPGVGKVEVVDPLLPPTDPNKLRPVDEIEIVKDDFVPGHFMELSNAQKLSSPSYDQMDAGVSVAADRIRLGSSDSKLIEFVTKFIDDDGTEHANQPRHPLTHEQLVAFLKRSPAALGGARRAGGQKYMLANRPKKVRLAPREFVVADACTLVRNAAVTGAPVSQTQAALALRNHLRTNPADAGRFTVVPRYAEAA